MLAAPHTSPQRIASAAVVAGLHGVVLSIALLADAERFFEPAPRAIDVRIVEARNRPEAERPLPVAATLQPPAPLSLPRIAEFAIAAQPPQVISLPGAAASESAPQVPALAHNPAPVSGDEAAAAQSGPAPAEPVFTRHVEYAHFEPPVYPPLSRRLGEQGVVTLRVLIDEEGRPVEVTVSSSSGYPRLDEAALRAVRAARFLPLIVGHRPRPAFALVPVRFELT